MSASNDEGTRPMVNYQVGPDDELAEGTWVLTRYPSRAITKDAPRESWPWWVATVEQQCGRDEWQLMVWGAELAELEDGSPAPEGTADEEAFYPLCFRDHQEIRRIPDDQAEAIRDRGGMYEGVPA